MELFLREMLSENIKELNDEIYPLNAPETSEKPYLVYAKIGDKDIKTLEGFTNSKHSTFMFSIMAKRYSEMAKIRKKTEKLIKSLIGKSKNEINIEDVEMNKIEEVYEFNLKLHRGIIDFTVY